MVKKLTLKEKAVEGFMCASTLRSYANRLAQDAKDFGWHEAAIMAKEMEADAKDFINKFKN